MSFILTGSLLENWDKQVWFSHLKGPESFFDILGGLHCIVSYLGTFPVNYVLCFPSASEQ